MFAVIASGGKQHRVVEGEILRLEKLDVPVGETIEFDKVLMVGGEKSVELGRPYVADSKVSAEVLGHSKAAKIQVVKFHRRKGYQRRQGHRQWCTEVKIKNIISA